jgi:hypothetical protein
VTTRQTIITAITALGLVISYTIVQGMFDRADHRKAEQLVRTFAGKDGKTSLEDLLAEKDPAAHSDLSWSSEILSGCRGFVRVRCRLPQAGEYDFDTDLVQRSIHPGNEAGKQALEALGGRTK